MQHSWCVGHSVPLVAPILRLLEGQAFYLWKPHGTDEVRHVPLQHTHTESAEEIRIGLPQIINGEESWQHVPKTQRKGRRGSVFLDDGIGKPFSVIIDPAVELWVLLRLQMDVLVTWLRLKRGRRRSSRR